MTNAVPLHTQKAWKRSKIQCVESGLIFESLTQLCKVLNKDKSTMSNHLAGRTPHVGGLRYIRVDTGS